MQESAVMMRLLSNRCLKESEYFHINLSDKRKKSALINLDSPKSCCLTAGFSPEEALKPMIAELQLKIYL